MEDILIDKETLRHCLEILLSAGADYADIYAEKGRIYSSVSDDRKISTSSHDQVGAGIRAVKDFADFYIACENLRPENLIATTKQLASGLKLASRQTSLNLSGNEYRSIYSPEIEPGNLPTGEKIEMLKKAAEIAWDYSNVIKQVTVRYSDFDREILFASSENEKVLQTHLALIEFLAFVYAGNGDGRQLGWAGKSFYQGWEAFRGENSPEEMIRQACAQAAMMLDAKACPSGEMPVIFAPGPNGVLFHESCGHGMEADLIQKGSSFSALLGQQVASSKVTIKDSGLIPGLPGSYAFDDEGVDAQEKTLIEKGVLAGYLHSRITARQMDVNPTGSGRRQSFHFPPIPRMRNTYIENGDDDPEEIIKSTKKGLYARDVGFGGQVDVVTGRFITSIILGYMIEEGKLTYPVKGATITGLGIEALQDIDRVGNDLVIDPSPGRCGKGQEVPVGVGMPTIRVKKLVVGGTGSSI